MWTKWQPCVTHTLSGSVLAPKSLRGSFSFLLSSFTDTLIVMSVSEVATFVVGDDMVVVVGEGVQLCR